ncbi:MAG: queuosine salvage family protein [Chloroflexi bacterium]|nr:queuosine salvage family protein [Chloroflexota bacterium]
MLGVLESTQHVVSRARAVRIDQEAVERLAARLADRGVEAPEWRVWPHWWEDSDRAANYVLVLDALNFCFWAAPGEPRWRVQFEGQTLDGYWALAACLRRALDAGTPLLDPDYLADIDEVEVRRLFAGEAEVPLLAARVANLREVGQGLRATGGSFAAVARAAGGSGEALVAEVVRRFPSFDDVARYDGQRIVFHKRAQILIGDLHGIYGGHGLGAFSDLARLTAFADYKIPQVLREAGILIYAPDLAATVERQALIPPGDPREVEIRAATIWGCERLRLALAERRAGPPLQAFEVDWLLWSDAQGRSISQPYHRTRTIYY